MARRRRSATSVLTVLAAVTVLLITVLQWGWTRETAQVDETGLVVSGPITVTEPGTTIQGLHVRGAISIRADDVTIERTTVSHSGVHAIRVFPGVAGTRIVDTSVECLDERTNGVVFGGYTAERVAVAGCRNAFVFSESAPATVIDSTVDGEPFSTVVAAPVTVVTPSDPEPTSVSTRTSPTEPSATSSVPYEPVSRSQDRSDGVVEAAPAPAPTPPPDVAEPAPQPEGPAPPPPPPGPDATRGEVVAAAGPRAAPTATLSGPEAEQVVIDTGLLERVTVSGGLDLSRVSRPYTIRDVVVDAGGARYGIRTMVGYAGVGRPDGPQVIEHVEVRGATSAGLYVRDVTVRHADVWGNIDNVKASDRVHMTYSWLHDQSWTDGAHADAIQIQSGLDQYYAYNVIDATYGDAGIAGASAGDPANAGLQTGSMNGEASARFHHNWFDGGHYTVRLGDSGPPLIDYQFRDNRFGRSFSYGPVTGSTSEQSGFGGVFFDGSNVWEDTGRPV